MKLKNKLKLTFISLYMRNIYCRDKSLKLYIGPWVLADDFDWSEDEKTVVKVLSSESHK